MITAEELSSEFNIESRKGIINHNGVYEFVIEFAKLHVEAALKQAEIIAQKTWGNSKMMKESILNVYPLENIK